MPTERPPNRIADGWRAAFQDAAAAAAPSSKLLTNGWHDGRALVGAQPSLADLASANPLYDDAGCTSGAR